MNATAALPVVGVDLAKSVFQLAVADASWRVIERHRLTRRSVRPTFQNLDVHVNGREPKRKEKSETKERQEKNSKAFHVEIGRGGLVLGNPIRHAAASRRKYTSAAK